MIKQTLLTQEKTRTDFVQRPAALTTYQHIVIEKNLSNVFYIYRIFRDFTLTIAIV